MPVMLVKHGTNSGYKAELASGQEVCERCRKARRVFNSQYTKTARARGIKYGSNDVLDHLYKGGRTTPAATRTRTDPARPRDGAQTGTSQAYAGEESPPGPSDDGRGPSLTDRLSDALGKLRMPAEESYVASESPDDYLHEIEPDPDPDDTDYSSVKADEFVINAAGMAKIEENLGTYLSVVGMTVEMIDPYCGPILYENFDNMVNKWSKVIAKYPAAANLFLDGKSGVIFTWISALQATWPILKAVYDHHLSKTVVTRNGQAFRAQSNGQAPQFDATTPPMQDFNYSAT